MIPTHFHCSDSTGTVSFGRKSAPRAKSSRPNGAFSKSSEYDIEILECTAIYDDDDDDDDYDLT